MFNPYEEHATEAASDSWTCSALYLDPLLVEKWLGSVRKGATIRFDQAMVRDPVGAGMVSRLCKLLGTRTPVLEIESAFVETMLYFFGRHGSGLKSVDPASNVGLTRARDFLETDFSAEVGLSELAREAGLPPVALLRGFREAFGCTPRVYSTASRVSAAKRALRAGMPLADAAAAFGFCDQSHLTRVFQRWTGMTPGAFASN
jgi:AraC-like DNA-binding protein